MIDIFKHIFLSIKLKILFTFSFEARLQTGSWDVANSLPTVQCCCRLLLFFRRQLTETKERVHTKFDIYYVEYM